MKNVGGIKMSRNYVFIDFEFSMNDHTSTKDFFQEIIEVGTVVVQNNTIYDTYSSFVKPAFFPVLTKRCKTFLSIEQEQVSNGVEFHELVEMLHLIYSLGNTIVVTWGNMDMYVLRKNCEKHNLSFPKATSFIDLARDYKQFFGDQNHTGLWRALEAYGENGKGKHHRALDDALTTYEIFKKIENDKKYMKNKTKTTLGDLFNTEEIKRKFAT